MPDISDMLIAGTYPPVPQASKACGSLWKVEELEELKEMKE